MCTLSFLPTETGFLLGMNRDEQRARPVALPPALEAPGPNRRALYPREESGGTWIGVNDLGVTLALLNWYSVPPPPLAAAPRSRGLLIPQLLQLPDLAAAAEQLTSLDLASTLPFRLIGINPARRGLREWSWDGRRLNAADKSWDRAHWFSSGFDEPQAQRVRATACRALPDPDAASRRWWLQELHASHRPVRGPFSVCMHREDAATVSFTTIEVTTAEVALAYAPGPPCRCATGAPLRLPRNSPPVA